MTREEAIKWLQRIENTYIHGGDEAFDESRKEALHMATEALKADRPRGEWIDAKLHGVWKTAKDGKYGCSACGLPAPGGGLTSFCPNCGAKMDGEGSEE